MSLLPNSYAAGMGNIAEETRWLDATTQAELVRKGEVTASELVAAAMERIEALNGPLNAVNIRWFEEAVTTAAGAGLPDGSLRGVPFLLKDLWANYAGQPITNGNRALKEAGYRADADTTLVSRFRAAGLVTLGRTASPEWGSLPTTEPVAFGPTRNPWDTARSPGGSSGGSAAAVAAGMVAIAHASDGGGSIRIPASCCGLVGLKPSQGRITVGPLRDESGLGVELCVSRTVRDTAALLDAVHGPGVGDTVIAARPARPYVEEVGADPGRLRIGLLAHNPRGLPIHAECESAARRTAALLERLGHHVEEAYPAVLADEAFGRQFGALWATNMAIALQRTSDALGRPVTADDVEPVNWAMAEMARGVSGVDYAQSMAAVSQFRRTLQAWWLVDGWDLLLTPTLGDVPAPIGTFANDSANPLAPFAHSTAYVPYTPAYNASFQPAINVPMHWTPEGLPVGVHLVAAYGREDILLRVAAQLEQAQPWAHRRPPTGP